MQLEKLLQTLHLLLYVAVSLNVIGDLHRYRDLVAFSQDTMLLLAQEHIAVTQPQAPEALMELQPGLLPVLFNQLPGFFGHHVWHRFCLLNFITQGGKKQIIHWYVSSIIFFANNSNPILFMVALHRQFL